MRYADLYADAWAVLTTERKQERIAELLAELPIPFQFVGMRTFSMNGVANETAVLDWRGRRFVFVPGRKRVVLGWDSGIEGLDESTRKDIEFGFESVLDPLTWWRKQLANAKAANDENAAYFEEQVAELEANPPEEPDDELKAFYSYKGLEAYINENTSPVRTVDLQPMISECELNEVGLIHAGQVDRRTREHQVKPEYFDRVKDYLYEFNTESEMTEYSGRCRFQRTKTDPLLYNVYVHERTTREDLIAQLHTDGFSLPSEDQWEYLCGAGRGTLFPFGSRFDAQWRYAHMSEEGENVLEQPNMFGLTIAYDPYKYETVDSPCHVKGGDGGGALCGGEPFIYTMLPLATYWRETPANVELGDDNLANGYYFYRRVLIVE